MNDFLKVALLGVGGYFIYEYLFGSSTPVIASTTPVTSQTVTQAIATTGTVATPVTNPVSIPSAAALTTKAGSSTQNLYQWIYWYNALTGRGSNWDTLTWPVDGSTIMDASTFLGYLGNMGLSGLRGGLGMIVDLQKLFAGVKPGTGFGAREFSAGPQYGLTGLGTIVDDSLMSAGYIDENVLNEAAAFGGSESDPTTQDFYLAVEGQGT
jgi:hypothetical protein